MNDASEVKLHFLDYWRIIKVRAGLITLAFLVVMVRPGYTDFLPRSTIESHDEIQPDFQSGDSSVALRGGTPHFIPTNSRPSKNAF